MVDFKEDKYFEEISKEADQIYIPAWEQYWEDLNYFYLEAEKVTQEILHHIWSNSDERQDQSDS